MTLQEFKHSRSSDSQGVLFLEELQLSRHSNFSILNTQFGSTNTGEVASALSGNSIVGKKTNSRQPDKETESKMLLFNGLYYKGNWAIPFQVNITWLPIYERLYIKFPLFPTATTFRLWQRFLHLRHRENSSEDDASSWILQNCRL